MTPDSTTGTTLEQQITADLPPGYTWTLEVTDPQLTELRIEGLEAA